MEKKQLDKRIVLLFSDKKPSFFLPFVRLLKYFFRFRHQNDARFSSLPCAVFIRKTVAFIQLVPRFHR